MKNTTHYQNDPLNLRAQILEASEGDYVTYPAGDGTMAHETPLSIPDADLGSAAFIMGLISKEQRDALLTVSAA